MTIQELQEGQKVHYVPSVGELENGIVKSFNDKVAFVVYKCNGEWSRYRHFTAAPTDPNDLKEGWV